MNHDLIEELLAARVLGGLADADAARLQAEMASHGDCEECRRLEREFADTAGRLAFSLDPVAVDPGMADRILASSRSDGAPVASHPDRSPSRRRLGAVVAAAAAVALVVVVAFVALRPSSTTHVEARSTQTVVHFEGDNGALAMAYSPGEPGLVFWGTDLPDPGADRVYEIWMIEGETPVSAGCVSPAADGHLAAFVDADLGTTELMAVTVEPASCPSAPTSDPVLTAPL
jgi:anti-sigma-K factor RskA